MIQDDELIAKKNKKVQGERGQEDNGKEEK